MNNNTSEANTVMGGVLLINQTFPNAYSHGLSLLTNTTNDYVANATEQNEANITHQGGYTENKFYVYFTVTVTAFGIGGNFLCLLIMMRPPFSEMPHSLMCAALSLVDLIFMLYQLAISMAAVITNKDVAHFYWLNRQLCKLGIFLPYLCIHLGANIIVGLSIERVICVFRPLQAAHIITKFKIKSYLAVIFIFFILMNWESAFRYDWYEIPDGDLVIKICKPMHFYGLPIRFWQIKELVLDLLANVIPLLIISVCNVALIIKLARRRQMQAQLGVSTNERGQSRTNHMIIAIMMAFLILLSPKYFYHIAVGQKNLHDPVSRILGRGVILNSSINFVLYFLASSAYRKAVKALFKFK